MLIGKKHKILAELRPLYLALDEAIKQTFDMVKQPDTLHAISARDAVLEAKQKFDDLTLKIETRKWKKEASSCEQH